MIWTLFIVGTLMHLIGGLHAMAEEAWVSFAVSAAGALMMGAAIAIHRGMI